jgi:site-specific recombinase XerD
LLPFPVVNGVKVRGIEGVGVMATKYKKRGVWYIRHKNEFGKWVGTSCGPSATATDAEVLLKKHQSVELNTRHQAPVRTVQEEFYTAIEAYRRDIVPQSVSGRDKVHRSIRREQVCLENFVRWANQQRIRGFSDVPTGVLLKYLDKRKTDGMSIRTRREERRMLGKFFDWAMEKHICNHNPVKQIPNPKLEKKRPMFFTHEELADIFAKSKMPYRSIFQFLYLTGLRIGELGNLEEPDYLEHLQQLHIRIMPGNKTKREEPVYLNKSAIAVIREVRAWKKEQAFETENAKQYLFVNAEGYKIDNDNIYRNLKRVLKDCEIPRGTPHVFRHTCASHLVISGVSLYIVKDILRHASIKETEIYSHLSQDAIQTAVEKLSIDPTKTN